MIVDLVDKLCNKYNKQKEDVLFDLIRTEDKYHNKQLRLGKPDKFDRCYFLIAAGYLNQKYKNEVYKK